MRRRICPFGHFKRGKNQKSETVRQWEIYTWHHISFPSHISLCYPISLHFSFQNCAFYYVSKRIPLFFLNLKIVLKSKCFPLRMHYTLCRISFLQPNTNMHKFFFFNLHRSLFPSFKPHNSLPIQTYSPLSLGLISPNMYGLHWHHTRTQLKLISLLSLSEEEDVIRLRLAFLSHAKTLSFGHLWTK